MATEIDNINTSPDNNTDCTTGSTADINMSHATKAHPQSSELLKNDVHADSTKSMEVPNDRPQSNASTMSSHSAVSNNKETTEAVQSADEQNENPQDVVHIDLENRRNNEGLEIGGEGAMNDDTNGMCHNDEEGNPENKMDEDNHQEIGKKTLADDFKESSISLIKQNGPCDNMEKEIHDSSYNNENKAQRSINSETENPHGEPFSQHDDRNVEDHIQISHEEMKTEVKRIRSRDRHIDRLKMKLYLEATKSHRGKSVDRIFSDYCDTIGRYLSTGENCRANSEELGIDTVLESFLITKRMRKYHNNYVKALMEQCFQVRAIGAKIENHIPRIWRGKVQKIAKIDNISATVTNQQDENSSGQDSCSVLIDGSSLSGAFENCGSLPIIFSQRGSESNVNEEESRNSMQSPRLPGMLEIDHLSHQITARDGYCLSQEAQWVTVIAIREFLTKIMQKTMMHFESKDAASEEQGRKRRKISNYDFVQVMDDAESHTNHFSVSASSRIAWEHFTLNTNTSSSSLLGSALKRYQTSLYNLMDERTHQNEFNKNAVQVRPGSARLGKGKDLMAMRARHSKPSSSDSKEQTRDEMELNAMMTYEETTDLQDDTGRNSSAPSQSSQNQVFRSSSLSPDGSLYQDINPSDPKTNVRRSSMISIQRDLNNLKNTLGSDPCSFT